MFYLEYMQTSGKKGNTGPPQCASDVSFRRLTQDGGLSCFVEEDHFEYFRDTDE